MRPSIAVLVAALVVLAGCGAAGPATDATEEGDRTTTGGTDRTTTAPPADPGDATTEGGSTDGDPGGSTDPDEGGSADDRTTTDPADGSGDDGTDGAAGEDDATDGDEGGEDATDDRAPWPPDDGPPRVETVSGDRPDLNYSATRVLRRIERLHALNATGDVRLTVDLPPRWIANDRTQTRDLPDEAYGILPAGAVALQLESDAETPIGASSGVAKAINPRVSETVNVWEAEYVREIHNESQRVVLAHEFAHVLQFQHDLFGVPTGASTTDEFLVSRALVEGDAVIVHEQYRDRYDLGGGGLSPDFYNGTVTRPGWNVDLTNLAYYHGYRFFARTTDSAAERNEVLADPPGTTAALLHPESAPDHPVGDPTPPPVSRWDRYDSDRAGELTVRVALRANGLPYDRAVEAAAGWRHDRMVYLRQGGETGPTVVYWRTLWADAGEAREFAAAWRSVLQDRLNATLRDGLLVDDGTRDRPKSVVWINRDGKTVDVVTGSDRETVLSVLDGAGFEDPGNRSVG